RDGASTVLAPRRHGCARLVPSHEREWTESMLDTLGRRLRWPLDRPRADSRRERPVVARAKAGACETHSDAGFQRDPVRLDEHGRAGGLAPLPRAWSSRLGLLPPIAGQQRLSPVPRRTL